MERYSYKTGILLGLGLFASGALLFIPATQAAVFEYFLLALFVIACGLACLETAANPYITVLGPAHSAARRLNLSQSFNGLGSFIAPIIGGRLFFGEISAQTGDDHGAVQLVYVVIALVVIAIAILFWRMRMPVTRDVVSGTETTAASARPLFSHSHFTFAVVAQFFYVAAQVGAGAFFINYATDHLPGLSSERAAYLLSIALGCFLIGRFSSTALMGAIRPARLLLMYAIINVILSGVVIAGQSHARVDVDHCPDCHVLFHVGHVSDHFFPGYCGSGYADQARIELYRDGDCGRRDHPLVHGTNRGLVQYRNRILDSAAVFCDCRAVWVVCTT